MSHKFPEQWLEQASEPRQEAVVKALLGARDAMLRIRYHMRLMGEAAGVPVGSFHFDGMRFSYFSFHIDLYYSI